jgi:H+/Cl- antiporter ClcA
MTEHKQKKNYPQLVRSAIYRLFTGITIDKEITDNFLRAIPLWIASLVVGVVAVLYARIFAAAEHLGQRIFSHTSWMIFIITPVCFIAAWLIVRYGAPFARGSGIPQVIASLEAEGAEHQKTVTRLIGARIIFVKIVSSVIIVFGGGAVGREGPTIQISAAIYRLAGRLLPAHWPKYSERVMILTGSAAGLAAAFNTPLGGIVFAIEELSKSHFTSFRTSLLTAVIIAGLTAQMLFGPYLYLGYPQISGLIMPMVSLVFLVAVLCGVSGAFFSRIIIKVITLRKTMRTVSAEAMFTVGLALLLASTAFFWTPSIMGSGKETMIALLFHSPGENDPMLAPARFIGPILSFTSGAAAGIFAPSLSAGAAIGSFFSSLFVLTPGQTNILILAGMVGFLTAVTRSPFTSSILVLEMTDRHSLIFFLMLAGLVSYASAWLVEKQSLYERLKEGYHRELESDSGQ